MGGKGILKRGIVVALAMAFFISCVAMAEQAHAGAGQYIDVHFNITDAETGEVIQGAKGTVWAKTMVNGYAVWFDLEPTNDLLTVVDYDKMFENGEMAESWSWSAEAKGYVKQDKASNKSIAIYYNQGQTTVNVQLERDTTPQPLTADLKVEVTDAKTGLPISSSAIRLVNTATGEDVEKNSDGTWTLTVGEDIFYKLYVTKEGYKPGETEAFQALSEDVITKTIRLTPNEDPGQQGGKDTPKDKPLVTPIPEKTPLVLDCTPGKVKLVKVKPGKKKVKVAWKRLTKNVKGYQISLVPAKAGSKAKGKIVTVKQGKKSALKKTLKKTVKGLKAKTRLVIKVRAFDTVGGKTCYGPWSAARTVKVRK